VLSALGISSLLRLVIYFGLDKGLWPVLSALAVSSLLRLALCLVVCLGLWPQLKGSGRHHLLHQWAA
jgi:hypothetical protein